MSLSCRTGYYRQVLRELGKIKISNSDIHLLFGPMDILCKFEFNSIDDFRTEFFDQVRNIGGEEEWIAQSMTFFVIDSRGENVDNPFAYIFLNTHPRNLEKVQKAILEIPQIMTADTVFGLYDIICSVKARNREELEKVIDHIQRNIKEITSSVTAIITGNQFII
jgi:DNA-binding Lrp family transcriptional regulator